MAGFLSGKVIRLLIAALNLFAPIGTRIQRDVAYGALDQHRADIYQPPRNTSAPIIVFFYGGGWRGGSKEAVAFVGASLARRGFVVVVPEYRHFPLVHLSGILSDNAAAVAWTIAHGAEFGGDPSRVIVAGHSSGAWAAAMLALDSKWLEGAGSQPSALAGFIGMSGPYSVLSLTSQADRDVFAASGPEMEPINHSRAQHPPTLILSGALDADVLPSSSGELSSLLQTTRGVAEARMYSGLGHDGILRALSFPFSLWSSVAHDVTRFGNHLPAVRLH